MSLNNCEKCKLDLTSCVTHSLNGPLFAKCIMGVGPKTAKIMIIGEALGQQEVIEKTPFVGSAGKMLNEGLENAGIRRDEVYITNVVKCRPPDNRTPSKAEVKYCLPFLEEEIKEVKPKVVCLLGAVALETVAKMKGITRIRGNVFDAEFGGVKFKIIPTWHPSYVIRFPEYKDLKSEFIKDLNLLRQVAESDNYEKIKVPVNYEIILDVKDSDKILQYIEKIERTGYFSYDLETTGFNFLEDKIILCGLSCAEHEGIAFDIKVVNENNLVSAKLKSILESKTLTKIAHHSKFDNKFLRTFGINVCLPIFDTMYAYYLIDENSLRGLKDLAWKFTDMGGYDDKIDYEKFKIWDTLSESEKLEIANYCAGDVDATVRMYKRFLPELEKQNLKRIHDLILMPLQMVLQETEYNGVPIDLKYTEQLEIELTAKIKDMEFQLNNLESVKEAEKLINIVDMKNKDGSIEKKIIVPGDKKYRKFNFDSPQQLQILLFKVEKLEPHKQTKTGYSTDAESLETLKNHSTTIRLILEYRKASHILGTYVGQLRREMDKNGRVHTDYRIDGSVSGRIISEQPNLQNIPRDETVKTMFIAEPGCALLDADYSSVEYKVWANLANDKQMLEDIRNGLDIHSEACCYMWPMLYKKVDKQYLYIPNNKLYSKIGDRIDNEAAEHRTKAKNVIFGVTYGRGIKSLVEEYGLTDTEARMLTNWILNKYPIAKKWIDNQKIFVRKNKCVYSMFGRVRRLPGIDSNEERTRSDTERQAVNTPVQSSASDIMSISTIRIYNILKKRGLRAKLFFTIHDSVKYNVPIGELDTTIQVIEEGLKAPITRVNFPLEIEMHIGINWGHLVSLEEFNESREKYLKEWNRC